MPERPKLNVAVVGAGLIGRRHVDLVRANPAFHLTAIVDPAPAAAAIAEAASVPRLESLDDLFAKRAVDGVIVATPNKLHVEQTLTCLRNGAAVLVEKPVAENVTEGERLLRVVEESGARVLVGHHRSHNLIIQKAREIISSGQLGRLVAVTGSAMFYKPDDYFDAGPWRRTSGGGPILINLIHEIGLFRAFGGEIEAVQALSSSSTRGFPVEDTVAIGLRFANGALGTFMLSDCAASALSWEQTSRENPDYPTYPDEDCYVVAGTDGSLSIPTMRLKTYGSRSRRSWWLPFATRVIDVPRVGALARQLDHFGAVIRGEAEPLVSVRDGLQNLRVVEAVSRAASDRGIVALPPPE